MTDTNVPEPLLTPSEVAAMFRVDGKTVGRWERAGKFPEGCVIRTPGGTRRYRETVIRALLNGETPGSAR